MVLNNYPTFYNTTIRLVCAILFVSLISACSHLGSQTNSNSSPVAPIIPVADDVVTQPFAPQPQLAPTNVLGSILDSAKKAIGHQQWLRAQHHLEHALRVAPKDAEIFYIYADVYEGLGVNEQVINMLKRAKFLAKPDSKIYRLSSERLKRLTQ
tara:strand:- start:20003 stop:20464 length:462 start_codon:yes stop_codon:yes gene_type:complete